MAYIRRTKADGRVYIYICTSVRRGRKVSGKVLEYLGREDKIDPARLRKAIEYWGVSTKVGRKGKARKRGGR